jgi:hypothetical protein
VNHFTRANTHSRKNCEVEALDAQRRDAEQHADGHRHDAAEQEDQDEVGFRHAQQQIVGCVRADRHEAAGAERKLPAIAGQDVEPDRGERQDQHRDQHLGVEVLVGEKRHRQEAERDQANHEPPILRDREDRLIGLVGGLELSGFAIEHGLTYLSCA